MDAPWERSRFTGIAFEMAPESEDGSCELLIHEYRVHPRANAITAQGTRSFAEADFSSYLDKCLPLPQRYQRARKLAAYITWSSVVEQNGYLPRCCSFR